MFTRPVLAAAALLTTVAVAPAQSITGDWIDPDGSAVHIGQSNSRYRGTFVTGPAKDRVALMVVPAGDGSFEGKRYTYGNRSSSHNVTVRLVSGELRILICARTADAGMCMNDQTWRRRIIHYRELSPKVRDEIRKPKPPPVMQKIPGVIQKGSPG